MYQAVIFSLKVSQNFISYESAEDRGFLIFDRVKNALSCNIFTKWPCLTYLPKMNLFPSTAFLPEGFENGKIQRF